MRVTDWPVTSVNYGSAKRELGGPAGLENCGNRGVNVAGTSGRSVVPPPFFPTRLKVESPGIRVGGAVIRSTTR